MATFADRATDSVVSGKCGDDFAWFFGTIAGAEKSCDGADVDPFSWRACVGAVVRGKFFLPCLPVSIAEKCRPEDVCAAIYLAEGTAKQMGFRDAVCCDSVLL